MPIVDKEGFEKGLAKNQDSYGKCVYQISTRVMEILDEEPDLVIDASALINRADEEIGAGGITGFMAGCAANIVAHVHSRGEEFKRAWNRSNGVDDPEPVETESENEERAQKAVGTKKEPIKGVVNPAILTIKKK